jgi:hypothetical protein
VMIVGLPSAEFRVMRRFAALVARGGPTDFWPDAGELGRGNGAEQFDAPSSDWPLARPVSKS